MKVIRKSVFEKNSSSCHSLSIERSVSDNVLKKIKLEQDPEFCPCVFVGNYNSYLDPFYEEHEFSFKLGYVLSDLIYNLGIWHKTDYYDPEFPLEILIQEMKKSEQYQILRLWLLDYDIKLDWWVENIRPLNSKRYDITTYDQNYFDSSPSCGWNRGSVNDLWNRSDMLYFLLNEESYIENVGND